MQRKNLPEWEKLLSSAAHLQRILPEAVLVGGTASALDDADHILTDLQEVLEELESVAGWRTARIKRPVMILGSLDGIETGVRQLIRDKPLETTRIRHAGAELTVPTQSEILRIKGVLILKRNATRDYLDFAALADCFGEKELVRALRDFDSLTRNYWGWDMRRYKGTSWDTDGTVGGENIVLKAKKENPVPLVKYRAL